MEKEISALFRARNTLLWIVSREESRVEGLLAKAAATARSRILFWDCAAGMTELSGRVVENIQDPQAALGYIAASKERIVYVMRDLHKWLGDPVTLRMVKSLAKDLQASPPKEARSLVLLTTSGEVPAELPNATVIDWPLPSRAELGVLFDDVMSSVEDSIRDASLPVRDQAIDAAIGLLQEEAANCYAKSIVESRRVVPAKVVEEKKRVIAREKLLEWFDPDPRGLDGVGGLDYLKSWLSTRVKAFSPEAREFGLPTPKGILLVGVPGCGKSLTAKCVSSAWGMPLLRLDFGGLKDKYLGESEKNIRKAFGIAEAVSPCVVWIDEIEKALSGAQDEGGSTDTTSTDALGVLLNWMQERKGEVFVIATANDVSALPPELLRKGRFDELFFVDLPTTVERKIICEVTLKQYDRTSDGIDLDDVARATDSFSGAEIAAMVPEALFTAFEDNMRTISTADLLAAAATVVPLSKTASEKIAKLKAWAKGRARPTSLPEVEAKPSFRQMDL